MPDDSTRLWNRTLVLCFSLVHRVDLLTAGEAFEDLIFVGLDRLPQPGEEVKTSQFVATIGGGAVITAIAAARLGVRCGILSGLSDAARRRLARERVRVTNLRRADEPHAVTAALSTRSNRSFVTFNGVNDVLEPRLLAALETVTARHVHFAFYPRDCRRWERVIARLRENGATISWDFGWNEPLLEDRRFPHLVHALDFLFLNEQEAVLYGRRRNLAAATAFWKTHPRAVILKLGARGSRWVSATTDLQVPAPRVRALDTTGAGDAFNGGFLSAMLAGLPPRTCLRTGNHVGSRSTARAGGIEGLPDDKGWLASVRKRTR
jgi:sugar/nucleoside kinase (ribokinase family)